ncbi:hypothetical protein FBU59_007300 [Linderina macrospora]|uniref:Uncharacterized protein n=1 Tax=Linderina macrospora TaxID=4868 RepID=A0ACC1IXF2_9FUNG|nr:hypothetical protein FBU59_007300 [Linderina macrospora]
MSTTIAYPYEENGYTLYSTAYCPFAQRARRALSAAKVPYKLVEFDLQNKPDWYHLVNPQLKVPALRTPDGTILIESLVISEFVADQFPESQLIPTDAIERAQLRLFVEIFGSRVSPHLFGSLRAATEEAQKEHVDKLLAGLREVNDELVKQWPRSSGNGGPFWFGNKISLAETSTAGFVNLLAGPKHYRGLAIPETDEYAAYHKWVEAFSQHPAYTESKLSDKAAIVALKKFVADA